MNIGISVRFPVSFLFHLNPSWAEITLTAFQNEDCDISNALKGKK